MIENTTKTQDSINAYRNEVSQLGKKEFTLQKMIDYGFWPENLPTPYERQQTETAEAYAKRLALMEEHQALNNEISTLNDEKNAIYAKLGELKNQYDLADDYDHIKSEVTHEIMVESINRRAARKAEKELQKQNRTQTWNEKKANHIVFIGKDYSYSLNDKETNYSALNEAHLPVITTDKELADFLSLDYKTLRFLTYHRDVVKTDHYFHYSIPKKKGGMRQIAAPKSSLKQAQRKILTDILEKFNASHEAHGFIKGKSIISGATAHKGNPTLLINMDLQDFFPTITFKRVLGLFKSFGYSGYIASLLTMLCTYCERMPMEVGGTTVYVKTSPRILPQGSPASPMITNLICRQLDHRLSGLAHTYGLTYSRYADDMSFTYHGDLSSLKIGQFISLSHHIISEEGFKLNQNKTKFLYPHTRQCITGIVINSDTIGVPRDWVRALRATIHTAKKLQMSGSSVPAKKIQEISGKLCWLKSVNEPRYHKIITEGFLLINEITHK